MANSIGPNPFIPSFGEVPFILAGRDQLLREANAAFARPNRSPELTMLASGRPSSLKDIGLRLGKPSGHVGTYRERLMKTGVIDEADRNAVGFALPGFRQFLMRRL